MSLLHAAIMLALATGLAICTHTIFVLARQGARPRPALALGLAWLAALAVAMSWNGVVVHVRDTRRYLRHGEALLHGEWPVGQETLYMGYHLLTAGALAAGAWPFGIVALQVFLSALATVCVWILGRRLYDPRTGAVAAALFIGALEVHLWSFRVSPDPMFVSSAVISVCLLVHARSAREIMLALLAVAAASSLRPNGIALAGAAAVYAWVRARHHPGRRLLVAVGGGIVVLAVLMRSAPTEHVARVVWWYYATETTIWGWDGWHGPPSAVGAGTLPIGEDVAHAAHPAVLLLLYVVEQPLACVRLTLTRIAVEALHVRPYYSTPHNLILLATLLPAYALAGFGLRRHVRDAAARAAVLAMVLFQCATVGVIFADWDGRFLLPALPFVLVFTAAGAVDLVVRARPSP